MRGVLVGAQDAIASKKKKSIKHKTNRNTLPAFACWVKKVSVGGGAIFIRKICAECTFHKASNGPLQGGAWQGPCGQSGYFGWGGGVCVSFPRNVTVLEWPVQWPVGQPVL